MISWGWLLWPDVDSAAGFWWAALFWALAFLATWLAALAALAVGGVRGSDGRTWALKVAAMLFHALVGPPALVAVFQDPVLLNAVACAGCEEAAWAMARAPHLGPPEAVRALMPISVGYMVGDLVLCPYWVLSSSRFENVLMFVHHLFSMAIWPCTLYYDYCSRYVLVMLSTEVSTVFLFMRVLISAFGWKQSLASTVSGLLFTALFVLVRMVGAVPQLLALWHVPPWTASVAQAVAPGSGMAAWQVWACSTLLLPHMFNLFWGVKVLNGFKAAMASSSGGSSKGKKAA